MAKKDLLVARIPVSAKEIRKWWSKLDDGEAGDNLREAVQFYLDYSEYEDVLRLMKIVGISPEEAKQRIQSSPIPTHELAISPARMPSKEPAGIRSKEHNATPAKSSSKNDTGSVKGRVEALLDDD
jgi:hypothetical protein